MALETWDHALLSAACARTGDQDPMSIFKMVINSLPGSRRHFFAARAALMALDNALSAGAASMVEILRKHGARPGHPSSGDHPPMSCSGPNEEPFEFDRLLELIDHCKVNSIEKLLSLLPLSYRSNYLLVYASRALGLASADRPRAILFGNGAKTVLSFGTIPRDPLFNTLEVLRFDDKSQQFELRTIEFGHPRGADTAIRRRVSAPNPARCLSCHGASPRPVLEGFGAWPGVYFSEQNTLWPKEREQFKNFEKTRANDPRYRRLTAGGASPVWTARGRENFGPNLVYKFQSLITDLFAKRISADLTSNATLKRFRYALLGALSCDEDPEGFLTPEARSQLPGTSDGLRQDSDQKALDFEAYNDELLATLFPGKPESMYQTEEFQEAYRRVGDGANFDSVRLSRLRYLLEGLGQKMGWALTRQLAGAPYSDAYGFFMLRDLEAIFWNQALSAPEDSGLIAKYLVVEERIGKGQDTIAAPYYFGKKDPSICADLKAKSIAALGVP